MTVTIGHSRTGNFALKLVIPFLLVIFTDFAQGWFNALITFPSVLLSKLHATTLLSILISVIKREINEPCRPSKQGLIASGERTT